MKSNQFYCVKCKKKVICRDPILKIFHNKTRKCGVPALEGKCKICNIKIYKFVKEQDAEKYTFSSKKKKEKFHKCKKSLKKKSLKKKSLKKKSLKKKSLKKKSLKKKSPKKKSVKKSPKKKSVVKKMTPKKSPKMKSVVKK